MAAMATKKSVVMKKNTAAKNQISILMAAMATKKPVVMKKNLAAKTKSPF